MGEEFFFKQSTMLDLFCSLINIKEEHISNKQTMWFWAFCRKAIFVELLLGLLQLSTFQFTFRIKKYSSAPWGTLVKNLAQSFFSHISDIFCFKYFVFLTDISIFYVLKNINIHLIRSQTMLLVFLPPKISITFSMIEVCTINLRNILMLSTLVYL